MKKKFFTAALLCIIISFTYAMENKHTIIKLSQSANQKKVTLTSIDIDKIIEKSKKESPQKVRVRRQSLESRQFMAEENLREDNLSRTRSGTH